MNYPLSCEICGLSPDFRVIFYGMELPRVGAFTDFGGSRYRNPVHFLGTFHDFPLFSEFSGLVYYTGHSPGGGARFGLKIIKTGCLEAGKLTLKFDWLMWDIIREINI